MSESPQESSLELEPNSTDEPATWDASGRYWLLGGAAIVAGIMLLFELRKGFAWEVALFSAIAILGGLWALWMATTVVELSTDGVRLKRIVGSQQVGYAQLISVTAQGRLLNVLTVLYHPRRADGLVDTERVSSLLTPAVKNQDELLVALEAKVRV